MASVNDSFGIGAVVDDFIACTDIACSSMKKDVSYMECKWD